MRLIILIISLLSNVLQHQRRKQDRAAQGRRKEAEGVRQGLLPTEPVHIKWHADEHGRQERRERFKWSKDFPVWLSTLLAFAAFVISVLAVHEAQETTKQIKRQVNIARDTLVATERPWIYPDIAIGQKGLYFDQNGANVNLVVSLKNSGHTPALMVKIVGGIKIGVHMNKYIDVLNDICSDVHESPPDVHHVGFTVFPNSPFVMDSTYSFASNAELAQRPPIESEYIDPLFIGCVDYFTTFDFPAHHKSRFIYSIVAPIVGGGARVIILSEGDKAQSALGLRPFIEAGSFQAD